MLSIIGTHCRGLDNGGARGAREPREFGGSEKGWSQISSCRVLVITESTSGFEKLSMALHSAKSKSNFLPKSRVKPILGEKIIIIWLLI